MPEDATLDDTRDTLWDRAILALTLLAIDPAHLGGMIVKARPGPVRDSFAALIAGLGPASRIAPGMTDEAIFGGVDLTETLATGRVVRQAGVVERAGGLVVSMAERMDVALAARLGDREAPGWLIAYDEGVDDDETVPAALRERLAFAADLGEVSRAEAVGALDTGAIDAARHRHVDVPDGIIAAIATACEAFGIRSARAGLFALAAARACAALRGDARVTDDHLAATLPLTLAHRATRMPPEDAAPEEEAPPPPPEGEAEAPQDDGPRTIPDELLLEAIRALLPDDLLARLAAQKARAGRGTGSGAARTSAKRGRPLPARPGDPGRGRVDITATLRAAAPWQTIRARSRPDHAGLHIRRADIHLRRYEARTERVLIFTVDASGSLALSRLAEAKGAIELLLGQAYARRDNVALIAFRGEAAELLLPPTRSLVQAKRRLAALPGGGGTPLAAGLMAAQALAAQSKARGLTPTLALLTDGRANIGLDGTPGRAGAAADAERVARLLAADGVDGIVIDTGRRPEPQLRTLARIMGAAYLPMPRADAERLSQALAATIDG